MDEPHRARQVAESFGLDPGRYDRARPRYPDAMVQAIVAASPGPGVLDVGCGTGIAARQFQAAGCRVLGVEPDARMATPVGTAPHLPGRDLPGRDLPGRTSPAEPARCRVGTCPLWWARAHCTAGANASS